MKGKLLFFCLFSINSLFAQVASTPPMGWNSYNCYGSAVHENEVKENADYMAAHLKPFGWQYIVIDFLWAYDNPPGSRIGNPYQKKLEDGSFIPWLAMDENGRLLPNTNKFPSAFGGKGFKPLGDYIHSLGLKFGIHIMRGIPRQAVWEKTKVLNTDGITADMIADTSSTCTWMNHMYGIDMNKNGAQEYLNSLLDLYASWGVDFIKVDDIARPFHEAEIDGYQKAIVHCGRPVVLSISPGETPVSKAEYLNEKVNMWRMADDFWDDWKEMLRMFDYAATWQNKRSKGHWPDCDMLQIGKLSKRGPVGPERYSRFTTDELYTHMSFWCLFQSPLMMGGNLPENRDIEKDLLTNEEVIAVNQQAEHPHLLYKKDGEMIWISQAKNSADVYLGLFNTSDTSRELTINLTVAGFKGKVKIRDLWKRKNLGVFKKQFSQKVNAHGVLLAKLSNE